MSGTVDLPPSLHAVCEGLEAVRGRPAGRQVIIIRLLAIAGGSANRFHDFMLVLVTGALDERMRDMKRIGAVLAGVLVMLLVASVASAVVGGGSDTSTDQQVVVGHDAGHDGTTVTSTSMTRERTRILDVPETASATAKAEMAREQLRIADEQQRRAAEQAMKQDRSGTCADDHTRVDDVTCTGDGPHATECENADHDADGCIDGDHHREQAGNENHGIDGDQTRTQDRDRDHDQVAARETDANDDSEPVADQGQSRDRDRVVSPDSDANDGWGQAAHRDTGMNDDAGKACTDDHDGSGQDDRGEHDGEGRQTDHN